MGTYFLFSDECGAYIPEPNEGFLSSHPYYVRTSLLVPSSEYRDLCQSYIELKHQFDLPAEKEIKWSNQWTLRKIQKSGDELSKSHDLYFLKDYDYHKLIDFVENSIDLVSRISGVTVLTSVTRNHANWKMTKKRCYEMHIENHMQRVQFEMENNGYNIAVMFFDSVNDKTDRLLRDIYADLTRINRFKVEFSHIKDSLNIEHSHQSIGVQMADLVAGAVNSFFKAQNSPNNYERGLKMFKESIKPRLRCVDGEICGFGIMEIPRNSHLRRQIRAYLNKLDYAIP